MGAGHLLTETEREYAMRASTGLAKGKSVGLAVRDPNVRVSFFIVG